MSNEQQQQQQRQKKCHVLNIKCTQLDKFVPNMIGMNLKIIKKRKERKIIKNFFVFFVWLALFPWYKINK